MGKGPDEERVIKIQQMSSNIEETQREDEAWRREMKKVVGEGEKRWRKIRVEGDEAKRKMTERGDRKSSKKECWIRG